MALDTHSKFFFDYEVDSTKNAIDFDEGGPELNATLTTGSYTLTEFVTELQTALNNTGGQAYTVSVNRTTRIVTISSVGVFALLIATGSRAGTTAYVTAGFTGADVTGSSSYDGNTTAGQEYTTQFRLQSFLSDDDNQKAASATVNKTVSGRVEVVKFGQEKFTEFEFKFLTDVPMLGTAPIRSRVTGVADFRTFIQFLTTKAPIEFMPDEDTPATFKKLLLERTPEDKNGIEYKLKEQVTRKLVGFFESGLLKFRVLD